MPLDEFMEEVRNELIQEALPHIGKPDHEVAQALGVGLEHYQDFIKDGAHKEKAIQEQIKIAKENYGKTDAEIAQMLGISFDYYQSTIKPKLFILGDICGWEKEWNAFLKKARANERGSKDYEKWWQDARREEEAQDEPSKKAAMACKDKAEASDNIDANFALLGWKLDDVLENFRDERRKCSKDSMHESCNNPSRHLFNLMRDDRDIQSSTNEVKCLINLAHKQVQLCAYVIGHSWCHPDHQKGATVVVKKGAGQKLPSVFAALAKELWKFSTLNAVVLDEKAVTALTKASQCLYELQHYKKIMLGLALNSGEDREYILKAVAKGTDMCTEGTEFNTIVQSHPDLSPVYDAVCGNSEISKQIHNCLIGNVEIPFF